VKDYSRETLFGDKVISSISYDEQEIIRDILYLHADNGNIEADPTYSIGNFYKDGLVKPIYKFDKFPQIEGVTQADSNSLPLGPGTIKTLMFDPPFVMGGNGTIENEELTEATGIIPGRFVSFKDFDELKQMYSSSLKEFYRVLIMGGLLVFKCQDCIVSAKNHFTHVWVMNEALKIGFYPKDLFILLARNRLNDGRKQQHARKYHSYFLVFKKEKCKIDYDEVKL
jgi:hypothetical protein